MQMSVLRIKASEDETTIAVIVGENRYWDRTSTNQFLYVINSRGRRWSLSFEKEFPDSLRNFCSNFLFSKDDAYELIMVDTTRIVRYSFLEN